jgi:3',5'-cyclic AMP phosphodiesterase CpdA
MPSLNRFHGVVLAAALLTAVACSNDDDDGVGPDPDPNPEDTVVVVAAGDIVCGSTTPAAYDCVDDATAALVAAINPDAVLALGDLQYETASLTDFNAFYATTWGAFKAITWPVTGNHEYQTEGAAGYFDYFNGVGADSGRAGHRDRGYYSVTMGDWTIFALNTNCGFVAGGCGAGSPQALWLESALAESTTTCALAITHHPLFSSGVGSGATPAVGPLWDLLYAADVELVLAGHMHAYERFTPQRPDGTVDTDGGIRLLTVGTGGKEAGNTFSPAANSEVRIGGVFGVLKLTLRRDAYDWEFVPVEGESATDSGSGVCR